MLARISQGDWVQLHFSMHLADGALIDSSRQRTVAPQLCVGSGTLPEHFERLLLGLKEGDRRSWVLPAEKAFGTHQSEHIRTFNRAEFVHMDLAPGLVISFADLARTELPGVVQRVSEQEVVVDFNHPLAGRDIVFEVEIVAVRSHEIQPVQVKGA